MKKLLVILLPVLIAIPAFSQVKYGLKAGVSTSSLSMETLKTITSGSTSYTVDALTEAKYGFHGGAFVRLSLLGIYLQPELLFTTRTNEYTVTNVQSSASTIVKQNFNKIDIPVMLGFKLGPVRLNAGPAASLLISSPKDLIDDPDFKSMYSNMTIGYQAGIGVDVLKKLTIDVRYEGSLKKYQNQIESLTGTTFNLDDRANAFLLSLGLIF
jgi:outer membrane protein with beta-barrel domain